MDKQKLNDIFRTIGGIVFGVLLLLSPWYLPMIWDGFLYIVDCMPLLISIIILGVIILIYPIGALIVMSVYPANLGGDAVNKTIKELFRKTGEKK